MAPNRPLPATDADLHDQLVERFREVAALTVLLREQEEAFNEQKRTIEWLCRVAGALYSERGWRFLFPAAWRPTRAGHMLKVQGLFDGEAYLQLNPDVAATGTDPLVHYLRHGLLEGRPRCKTDLQNDAHVEN